MQPPTENPNQIGIIMMPSSWPCNLATRPLARLLVFAFRFFYRRVGKSILLVKLCLPYPFLRAPNKYGRNIGGLTNIFYWKGV
jgi:hypothetical protein